MAGRLCKCGKASAPSKKYCATCHAAYMREWRKTHPLTAAQKVKDYARSQANVYQKRGKIRPQPCEKCGSENVEKHHDNYDKPREVRWFCRDHHLAHPRELLDHVKR